MGRILFYLFVKPLSFLPLGVLQVLSNGLYYILYYLLRYRRKVVTQNLSNSFPAKSAEGIQKMGKQYYRYLADLITETLKLFSLSKKTFIDRCHFHNPEIFEPYLKEGKSVVILAAHYGNWEHYCTMLGHTLPLKAVVLFKPLHNKTINTAYREFRSLFGVGLIAVQETRKVITAIKKEPSAMVFIGDQSPTYSKQVHWSKFLNQETAVAVGGEFFAKKFDLPVFYLKAQVTQRGHHEVRFELIEPNPKEAPAGQITEQYTRLLEQQILDKPQYWIWSHRRWKRKRT